MVSGLELGGLVGGWAAGVVSDAAIKRARPGVGLVGVRVKVSAAGGGRHGWLAGALGVLDLASRAVHAAQDGGAQAAAASLSANPRAVCGVLTR
jgi:hypothetical protein